MIIRRLNTLLNRRSLKHFYDISNLISNTGGEESTDTDSDADFDEDTPINTRLLFRVPQNDLILY
jgi:hypothetical protein